MALNSLKPLQFKAGRSAFEEVRKHGFSPSRIGTLAGASGGAKWLVLSQIDRVIADRILPKLDAPVHLIGSSIGALRHACFAQPDAPSAIDRFEAAYIDQAYSPNPDRREIANKGREMIAVLFGRNDASQVMGHRVLRTHVLAVRSGLLTSSEAAIALGFGLLIVAAANLISRRALGAFFSRSLFYDARDLPPCFDATDMPLHRIALTPDNLADAIRASASIPLIVEGVRDVAGAPGGVYRDGGVIDYHLDLPLSQPGRLTLFPHFIDRLIPGWFDKRLSWRKANASHTDRTILVCPSAEFVSRLPYAKIPDRRDFFQMGRQQRIEYWRNTVSACRQLADDFADVLDNDRLAARLEPL